MRRILLISNITFQEGLRSRILAAILFFGAAIFALNFFLSNSFNYELSKVAVDISLSAVSLCSLLIIITVCINQLHRDIDRKVIFLFLSRPVARHEYILGKFLGFGLLLFLTVFFLGGGGAVSVWVITVLKPAYVTANFNWLSYFLTVFFNYLGLMLLVSIAILSTVYASTNFLAVLYTFGAYFAGHYLERVIQLLKSETVTGVYDSLLKYSLEIITWVIPNLSAFDFKQYASYGLVFTGPLLVLTFLYGVIYISLILSLSIYIFSKAELS